MEPARVPELIRIPRLRAVVIAVATVVLIGVAVLLRRYRGADRTAMALSLLAGGGICLTVGLARFQQRFCRRVMPRRALRGIGLRYGALAGALTGGIGIVLLALRWAMDQLASPVSDPFLTAFSRALIALGTHLAAGAIAYLAAGAVLGALAGLLIAEAIGNSSDRVAEAERAPCIAGHPGRSSGLER